MLKPRFKKIHEDDGVVEVDGVKLDAESAEIVFADKDKDIQVVVSNDPENENTAVVAVLTNSKEEVEDEQVLGSASVETEEGTVEVEAGAKDDKEEKCKEARREAFRKRLEARRAARKTDERREAFRKRLEARKAAKQTESKAKAIEEARAKFRSKIKKA